MSATEAAAAFAEFMADPNRVGLDVESSLRASRARGKKTAVTVVVLQWGQSEKTLACLEALHRSDRLAYQVIVVDNPSEEADAAARIYEQWPDIDVIENRENLGFAEGNNVVLRRLVRDRKRALVPRWCLLLNNDVEVSPSCVREMLIVADRRDAAVVGAINETPHGAITSSAGRIRWPSGRYVDDARSALALGNDDHEVQTVSGSTLLLDLDALTEVGYLDPQYFCVYEETDLCFRMRATGRRCWLATKARAKHDVSASTPRPLHLYYRFRNRFRFVERQRGRMGRFLMLPSLCFELAWRLPVYALLGRIKEARAILRGVEDGWKRHGGRAPGSV